MFPLSSPVRSAPSRSVPLSLSELTYSHHACLHCRPSKCGVRFRFRDTTSNGRTEKGEKRRRPFSLEWSRGSLSHPSPVRLSQSPNPNVRTSPSGGEDERTRAPETASSCMSSCCAQTQIRFKRRARGPVNRKDDKRGTPSSSPYAHCPPIHLILKTHLDKRARRPFLEFPQIPNPLRCPILFASLPEAPCLFQEPFCRLLALPASPRPTTMPPPPPSRD